MTVLIWTLTSKLLVFNCSSRSPRHLIYFHFLQSTKIRVSQSIAQRLSYSAERHKPMCMSSSYLDLFMLGRCKHINFIIQKYSLNHQGSKNDNILIYSFHLLEPKYLGNDICHYSKETWIAIPQYPVTDCKVIQNFVFLIWTSKSSAFKYDIKQ